jgi:hypothetical protein
LKNQSRTGQGPRARPFQNDSGVGRSAPEAAFKPIGNIATHPKNKLGTMQTWSNGAFAFGLSGECRRVFAILPPFSRSHYRYIINKIHRARTKMTLPQIKTDMNQEEMNLLLVQARKASDLLKL